MALIDCPECKEKKVSEIAEICLNCGYEIREKERAKVPLVDRLQKWSSIIIAVTVPLFGIVYGFFKDQENKIAKQQALADEKNWQAQELSARRADRAMKVTDRLANEHTRNASAMMALYFANVGELHHGIIPVLARTAMNEREFRDVLQSTLEDMKSEVTLNIEHLKTENSADSTDRISEMEELLAQIDKALNVIDPEKFFAEGSSLTGVAKEEHDKEVSALVESSGSHIAVPLAAKTLEQSAGSGEEVEDKAGDAVIQGIKAATREANEAFSAIDVELDQDKRDDLQERANRAIEKAQGLVIATQSASDKQRTRVLTQVVDDVSKGLNVEQRNAVMGKIAEVSGNLDVATRAKIFQDTGLNRVVVAINSERQRELATQFIEAVKKRWSAEFITVIENVRDHEKKPTVPERTELRYQEDSDGDTEKRELALQLEGIINSLLEKAGQEINTELGKVTLKQLSAEHVADGEYEIWLADGLGESPAPTPDSGPAPVPPVPAPPVR